MMEQSNILEEEVEAEEGVFKRNQAIGKHLFLYFQELCEIMDVDSIELTPEGQQMVQNVGKVLAYVSQNCLISGKPDKAFLN